MESVSSPDEFSPIDEALRIREDERRQEARLSSTNSRLDDYGTGLTDTRGRIKPLSDLRKGSPYRTIASPR